MCSHCLSRLRHRLCLAVLLRYQAEVSYNASMNNTNGTNTTGCYTTPLICYADEQAYLTHRAKMLAGLASPDDGNVTGNLSIGGSNYSAVFDSSLVDDGATDVTVTGPTCEAGETVTGPAPDGEDYDMTAPMYS